MYYWYILNKDQSELIASVLNAQSLETEKNDWYDLIQNDKKELNITLGDEEIRTLSTNKFKELIKQKI